MRAQGTPVSDELLQTKAKQLAEAAGVTDFKYSNGWLDRFKKRYGVRCQGMHGQAGDADAQGVELCHRALPVLITELGYDKEDVYNFDETGLFFKAGPKRTLVTRGAHLALGSRY
jgi:hypothetical protein